MPSLAGLQDPDGGRYVMYQWAGRAGRRRRRRPRRLPPDRPSHHPRRPHAAQPRNLRAALSGALPPPGAALRRAGPGRFRGGAGCDYEVEIFMPGRLRLPRRRRRRALELRRRRRPRGRRRRGRSSPWPTASASSRRNTACAAPRARHLSRAVAGRRRLWRSAHARSGARAARRARRRGQRGAAERDYGVAIAADGKSVDDAGTRKLRSRSSRLQ